MNERKTITYLETCEAFYDRERLQRFIQGLAQQGYYVTGSDDSEVRRTRLSFRDGEATVDDVERLFRPDVSLMLEREAEAFVEQRLSALRITLFSIAREGEMQGVEVHFALNPKSYTISSVLYGNSNLLEHYTHWLDLHRDMYTLWHPIYSYSDTDGAIPDTARATILAGDLEWLYEINLFSPQLVKKLGRERLLNIPVWRVEVLEDGSIFYVPELTYNGGEEEDYVYTREEIASQLGLRADEFGEEEDLGG